MPHAACAQVTPDALPLTVVLAEKPALGRWLSNTFAEVAPDHPWLMANRIVIIHLGGMGPWHFALDVPRRLPAITEPTYRWMDSRPENEYINWLFGPFVFRDGAGHRPRLSQEDFTGYLERAAAVVRLGDPDPRGNRIFHLAITGGRWAADAPPIPRCPIFDTLLWDREHMPSVRDAIMDGSLARWPADPVALSTSFAKEFFDWNWAVHNAGLIASYLRAAGCQRLDMIPKFQKTAIGLVLAMARDPDWQGQRQSEARILFKMEHAGLGSSMSRMSVIQHLVKMGFLEKEEQRGRQVLRLSPAGIALADLLPKDAWDPHQARRLADWCTSWPASRPAMERYLGTWWTKIKNGRPTAKDVSPAVE